MGPGSLTEPLPARLGQKGLLPLLSARGTALVLYVVHYPTEYDSYHPYSLGAFA
jgi:hypothetical protein